MLVQNTYPRSARSWGLNSQSKTTKDGVEHILKAATRAVPPLGSHREFLRTRERSCRRNEDPKHRDITDVSSCIGWATRDG